MTAPQSLRVVIAGVGRFGALHARTWQEAGATLVGMVDVDADRAAEVAARHGVSVSGDDLSAVLSRVRPDVVVVASDEASHVELSLQALDAGAQLFVEKPFALGARDAWAVHDAAAAAGKQVVTGHISRFVPAVQRMRGQIEAGQVGEVAAVRLRRDFSRAWFAAFGSRVHPVWESGIHDIDLAIFLAGARVRRVSAVQSEALGDAAPSVVSAHLVFDTGAIGTVEFAWLIPDAAPQTLSGALELEGAIVAEAEVHGTAGVLRQRQLSDTLTEWTDAGLRMPDLTLWPEVGGQVSGALRAEVAHAIEVFQGRATVEVVPLQQVCWGIEAAEAVVESLRTGAPVDIATRDGAPAPAESR